MGKMLDKLKEYLDNATQEELQNTYNKLSHLLCKDNSTIVERAVNVQHEVTPNKDWGDVAYGYERGATDQKSIDFYMFQSFLSERGLLFGKYTKANGDTGYKTLDDLWEYFNNK